MLLRREFNDKKFFSFFLVFTLCLISFSGVFQKTTYAADNTFTDTKYIPFSVSASNPITPYTAGSVTGGESIISQDTLWKYGITMHTTAGVVVASVAGIFSLHLKVPYSIICFLTSPLITAGINCYVKLSYSVNI